MGLHMDDLHTPSVPPEPAPGHQPVENKEQEKIPLLDLIAQKDRVEAELSALMSVLESVGLWFGFSAPIETDETPN